MRIGYDAKRLFNNFTGLGNYSRTLLTNLLAFYPSNDYHLFTPTIGNSTEARLLLKGANVHTHLPGKGFKPTWRQWGMGKQAKSYNLGVFHGLSNEIPFGLQDSTKKIVTIHDLIYKVYPETYRATDRALYDLKYPSSCKRADLIIAISNHTKNDVIKFYDIPENKIKVVYQSVGNEFFVEEMPGRQQLQSFNLPADYCIMVGSVQPRKNHQAVLNAMGQLEESSRVPLVVVGNGKGYLKKMRILAERLKLPVYWLTDVTDTETLRVLYTHALFSLYPSWYEGFGIPVVESLLCETPVITSSVSSLPEAGQQGTLLADPSDAEHIAYCIRKMSDSNLADKLGKKGKAFALARFKPEITARELMNCYLT
jgi:glycosyltransferase involved in cell wall biosynthesis